MTRCYNFGAGPATLPLSVLTEVQNELLEWQNTGMSILEIGHRTVEFKLLLQQTEDNLRALLAIPENYHVLFLGGSARTLFSMIPLNFLSKDNTAGYLVSGIWSKLAFTEAQKIANAYCMASSEDTRYITISDNEQWQFYNDTAYLYYTPNETVNGVYCPRDKLQNLAINAPIIADMTSCLLTEPINITEYDLIFAGAQKNIANAGLVIIIINNSMLEKITHTNIPTMLDFRTYVKHKSLYATPPTFNCYVANKMFTWLHQQGGVKKLHEFNQLKAQKIYNCIDNNALYFSLINHKYRSTINICFDLAKKDLIDNFIKQAQLHDLYNLRGHSLVGGLRVSLYNAMSMDGVDALVDFMYKFA